jgi:transposase
MMSAAMAPRRPQSEEMLSLLERHKIQVLLDAEFSAAEVAKRTGFSLDTVRRVRRESAVTHTDDKLEHRKRRVGRPSVAAEFSERVAQWLRQEPELPTQELLRRAKDAGYTGHKTAFYALVAGARPARAAPIVRFEGLPGEFSQHDFGHVDVRFVDGRRKRIHFFALRLKYSRYSAVTLVDNERVETIIRCLARDFVKFGGLPLTAVFDRPRTIVTKSGKGREVETFNTTFAQAIVDIGVGVEMCAPRSGNQKRAVERLVGWVKSSSSNHASSRTSRICRRNWQRGSPKSTSARPIVRRMRFRKLGDARNSRACGRSKCFRKSSPCAFPSWSDHGRGHV